MPDLSDRAGWHRAFPRPDGERTKNHGLGVSQVIDFSGEGAAVLGKNRPSSPPKSTIWPCRSKNVILYALSEGRGGIAAFPRPSPRP